MGMILTECLHSSAISIPFVGNEIHYGAKMHKSVRNFLSNLHAVDEPVQKTILVSLCELPINCLEIATTTFFH